MKREAASKRRIPFTKIYVGRYVLLLISMGLLIIGSTLFEDAGTSRVFSFLLLATLISGIFSVLQHRSLYIASLVLVVLWGVAIFLFHATGHPWSVRLSVLIACAFFAFTSGSILFTLFREEKVTLDVIYGAMAVYLLAAFAWASAYQFAHFMNPASFRAATGETIVFGDLYYFSFITMTTTGFGDIAPATRITRALTLLQAVFGQLYIAVIIARLVGMHLSRAPEDRG